MKEKLLKILKAKQEARTALVQKSETSQEVAELRSIHNQLEGLNSEIEELTSIISNLDGENARTEAVNNNNEESRSFIPGKGFKAVDGATFGESREQQEKEIAEKRGKELMEGRAVTVGASSIVLPQESAKTINGTFNPVSGLIDRVTTMHLSGGETFKQPYEVDTAEGDYTGEGVAAANADTVFGYAEISKTKVTAYSETTNEVRKLPAANYEQVVLAGIGKSCRRKITKEILIGDGTTNHLVGIFSAKATAIPASSDISLAAITSNTLNEIIFSFGGDEAVEDQATLVLHKNDLKAFSQLKTTDGKPYHTIVTNGNSGTIDGIPYIINSAGCKAVSSAATTAGEYCMAYGPLSNYTLAVFGDLDVQQSTDYKFKEGMICHRGEIYIGGNVVAHKGFVRVKKI